MRKNLKDKSRWININSMNQAHAWDTASLLLDGEVLVAGGFSGAGYVIFYEKKEKKKCQ